MTLLCHFKFLSFLIYFRSTGRGKRKDSHTNRSSAGRGGALVESKTRSVLTGGSWVTIPL